MTAWPEPLWQTSTHSTSKAWSGGDDNLWCLAYNIRSPIHVTYDAQNASCTALPPEATKWYNGWTTSDTLAEGAHFPSGDPGWRIVLPEYYPPSQEGYCYTMCLDISGDRRHTPPQNSADIVLLFCLPLMFDLVLVLIWVNQREVYGGWVGTMAKTARVRCTRCASTSNADHPTNSCSLLAHKLSPAPLRSCDIRRRVWLRGCVYIHMDRPVVGHTPHRSRSQGISRRDHHRPLLPHILQLLLDHRSRGLLW